MKPLPQPVVTQPNSFLTLVWIGICISLLGFQSADSVGNLETQEKQRCLVKTTTDSSYMVAVKRVMELPMVKTRVKQLEKQLRRVSLGMQVDKTEFISGYCYWSISLYEDSSDALRLWKVFLVAIGESRIFLMNADGTYVPILVK